MSPTCPIPKPFIQELNLHLPIFSFIGSPPRQNEPRSNRNYQTLGYRNVQDIRHLSSPSNRIHSPIRGNHLPIESYLTKPTEKDPIPRFARSALTARSFACLATWLERQPTLTSIIPATRVRVSIAARTQSWLRRY